MDTNTEGDGVTLTEFLLARIAEDESEARQTADYGGGWDGWPSRMLAECRAKRRIVAIWDGAMGALDDRIFDLGSHSLRALALPYADHPDFREEWRG